MFDYFTANACSPDGVSRRLEPNEWLTVDHHYAGVRQTTVTERDLPTLSKDDLNTSASEVAEAQKQELGK